MNVSETIERNQGTIYHELGHVIGYYLSNKFDDTQLGNISTIQIGLKKNCVMPLDILYHGDNKDFIEENTLNKYRTIAWLIEVLLGCTFQAIFEEKEFIFCSKVLGGRDMENINWVRNRSSFRFSWDQLFNLQKDLALIINNYSIIEKLKPIVSCLKEKIIDSPQHQIILKEEEISILIKKISDIIDNDCFITEYLILIDNYDRIMI